MRVAVYITIVLALASNLCLANEPQTRTWVSKTGKKMEAVFVKESGPRVVLQKKDGGKLMIALTSLSAADLEYIKGRKALGMKKAVDDKLAELGWKRGQQAVDLPESLKDCKVLGPKFYLFIPESYGAPKKGSPLIMFLHGAGERGVTLKRIAVHGIPKIAPKKKDFPFIAISPQCRSEKWWNTDELKKLLDYVVSKLEVDESRLYMTGLSMGGFGTWAMISKYPDLFAAAIPICGGGDPNKADKIKDLPIWVFHGDADKTVAIDKSQVMVDALKKHKSKVKFTIYKSVGHNSWVRAYNDPEIYDWLLEHKRK